MSQELSNLEELIDQIKKADGEGDKVSFDDILDKIGRRSFAPMLLLAGIITVAPVIGDIPGVPTIMGAFVLLTTGQLLFGRDHFWLPDWILKRATEKEKINKGMDWLEKPAKFIDNWSKPRLKIFTKGTGHYIIASVCFLIALAMPMISRIILMLHQFVQFFNAAIKFCSFDCKLLPGIFFLAQTLKNIFDGIEL